jgi:hypothetical protein
MRWPAWQTVAEALQPTASPVVPASGPATPPLPTTAMAATGAPKPPPYTNYGNTLGDPGWWAIECVLPHPGPLPLGEGGTHSAFGRQGSQSTSSAGGLSPYP